MARPPQRLPQPRALALTFACLLSASTAGFAACLGRFSAPPLKTLTPADDASCRCHSAKAGRAPAGLARCTGGSFNIRLALHSAAGCAPAQARPVCTGAAHLRSSSPRLEPSTQRLPVPGVLCQVSSAGSASAARRPCFLGPLAPLELHEAKGLLDLCRICKPCAGLGSMLGPPQSWTPPGPRPEPPEKNIPALTGAQLLQHVVRSSTSSIRSSGTRVVPNWPSKRAPICSPSLASSNLRITRRPGHRP